MLRWLRVPRCALLLLVLACGKSGACPDDSVDFGDKLVVTCDPPATCDELLAECPVDGSPCTHTPDPSRTEAGALQPKRCR